MTKAKTGGVPRAKGAAEGPPLQVRRHPLVSEVARRLRGECGVPAGTKMVVAVSGGADSCALLLACAAIALRRENEAPALEVIAAHVHHHLRPEADAEAAFVEALCAKLGVGFEVRHVHPSRERGSKGASARRLRYEALRRVSAGVGARFVATAHHAEDQLETMLMALGRGAGLRGLRGMKWARRLGDDITLVRPMLLARKRDCEALCTLAGVEWCEDSSNIDPRSKRARIRRDVLPIMEELWPGAARRSVGTAELLDAASSIVAARVEEAFGPDSTQAWDCDRVAALPPAVIAEGLRRTAEHVHGGPIPALTQRHLRGAATFIRSSKKQPKRFEWPGGIVVEVTSKTIAVLRA